MLVNKRNQVIYWGDLNLLIRGPLQFNLKRRLNCYLKERFLYDGTKPFFPGLLNVIQRRNGLSLSNCSKRLLQKRNYGLRSLRLKMAARRRNDVLTATSRNYGVHSRIPLNHLNCKFSLGKENLMRSHLWKEVSSKHSNVEIGCFS